MTLICPECMGTLETSNGKRATCTVHGGQFEILFSPWKPPVSPVVPGEPRIEFRLSSGAMCFQHPAVRAAFVCEDCGTPVCDVCVFERSDGGRVCPQCMARRIKTEEPEKQIPVGVHCVQHPAVDATRQCQNCGAYMCETCDFLLPGNLHLCPPCATAPRSALSPSRKRLLAGSYALAIFATVGMGCVMGGLFAKMGRTAGDEAVIGYLFTLLVLIPALIGMVLGFSAIDRRLATPIYVWIGTIWNIVIVVIFIALAVIGTASK